MSSSQWSLQDAKNKFSALVDTAIKGKPQLVTRRGKPAVVVMSVGEYNKFRHLEKLEAPSFTEYLLNMPADDEEFEPIEIKLRDFR